MTTSPYIPAFKTVDVVSGMALSIDLARAISAKLAEISPVVRERGETSPDEPGSISVEMIAGILFPAVRLANGSWKS